MLCFEVGIVCFAAGERKLADTKAIRITGWSGNPPYPVKEKFII
jgi:hypothetical protein